MVVAFRIVPTQHAPLPINGAAVGRISSTKFLGVHTSEDPSCCMNTTSLAKKAQHHLYFLRQLERASTPIMHIAYRGTIKSTLTRCTTVWYGSCTVLCPQLRGSLVFLSVSLGGHLQHSPHPQSHQDS